MACLLRAMRADVDRHLWSRAAQHRTGQGLEEGDHIGQLVAWLQQLKKTGDRCMHNTVVTAAAGGMWTRQRACAAGYSEEATCPYPGCAAEETDMHRVWECKGPAEDPAVARSKLLVARARAGVQQQPCLWFRGMPPAECGATPEAPAEEQFAVVGSPQQHKNGELVSWEGEQRQYDTDGSGGEQSKDRTQLWSVRASGGAVAESG